MFVKTFHNNDSNNTNDLHSGHKYYKVPGLCQVLF